MARRPSRDRWELGYPGGHGREQELGYPRYSEERYGEERYDERRDAKRPTRQTKSKQQTQWTQRRTARGR